MQRYQAEVEQAMKRYFATLAEKDQRLYAAVEAQELGRGGQRYIAELLVCSERTVSRGLEDLAGLPEQPSRNCCNANRVEDAIDPMRPIQTSMPNLRKF